MTDMPLPKVIREFLIAGNEHRAIGNSMYPSIQNGQKVILSPTSAHFIIGHIYIFLYNGRLLMHRLIATQGCYAFFMGDHSLAVEKVNCSDIIAEFDTNYRHSLLPLINFINALSLKIGSKWRAVKLIQMIRMWSMRILCKEYK